MAITRIRKSSHRKPPKITTFGDTIIIRWPVTDPKIAYIQFLDVGMICSAIVCHGIGNHVFYRGAISIGESIADESHILGPVIADAASWYEKPDLIGVIATPLCGQTLKRLSLNSEIERALRRVYVEYEVPFNQKSGLTPLQLWMPNWPDYATVTLDGEVKFRELHYQQVGYSGIPFGSQSKYLNTERFIDKALSNSKELGGLGPDL